jgi:hypothetical protein
MTDDIMLFDPERHDDDDALRALRAMYAAPDDAAYWDGLHRRILSYVAGAEGGWWTAFASWKRLGLVAASVALVAIGFGTQGSRDAETRAAYEAVLEDTTPGSAYERVTQTPGLTESEAMFQYVISYR